MAIKRKSKTITWDTFAEKSVEIFGKYDITKDQAKSAGLMFYQADDTCHRGHNPCYRYVANNVCRQCNVINSFKANHAVWSKEQNIERENRSKLVKKLSDLEIEQIEKDIYSYDF